MKSIVLLLLIIATPARAASRDLPCSFWDSVRLARRVGGQSCWVMMGELCISRAVWLEWLATPSPSPWCGHLEGQWKAFSPLENAPGHVGPKSVVRTWKVAAVTRRGPKSIGVPFVERTRERISEQLEPYDRMGLFRSLLLAERSSAGPAGFLRVLGFVHLLNATGIHLYALSAFIGAVLFWVCVFFGLSVRYAIPLARGLSFLAWSLAWILAGARAGMLRPWILVAARRSAIALGFRWRRWTPLVLSLAIDAGVAIAAGTSVLRDDRIFYALAVGGGMMVTPLTLSVGSWIFAALWEAMHTGLVATATPLLSAVTIPIFCTILYPWLLVASIAPSTAETLGKIILEPTEKLLELLTSWTLAWDTLWVVSHQALLAGSLVATLWLLARLTQPRIRAALGITTLVLLLIARTAIPSAKSLRIEQLDVGQGDGALIRSSAIGLIDTGSDRTVTDVQWITLLAQRGVTELDWIGLTHLDEDHSGGVRTLARLLPIGCLALTRGERSSERGAKWLARLPEKLPLADWDDGRCIPYPTFDTSIASRKHARNENMGALVIPFPEGAYLSAGDAEAGTELKIAKWVRRQNAGPFALKVSHHGSKFSTSAAFLRAIQPSLAVISVGVGNRYGHPSAQTLARLGETPTLRTDESGSIDVTEEVFRRRRRKYHP